MSGYKNSTSKSYTVLVCIKHQASDPFLQLTMKCEYNCPLGNDIYLLPIDTNTHRKTSTKDDNAASPQSFYSPIVADFLRAQAADTYYRMKHVQVGHNNSEFNPNIYGLLVRRSRINGAIQTVVTLLLRQRISMKSLQPPTAGRSTQCRMYDELHELL